MAKRIKPETSGTPTTPDKPGGGGKPKSGIQELVWVRAGDLHDNPLNWRNHPPKQMRALEASIKQNGWSGALLLNRRTDRLIDGHARRKTVKDDELVPVLVGDWSPEQERALLLTLDPISAMAGETAEALNTLITAYRQDLERQPELSDDGIMALIRDLECTSNVLESTNPYYDSAFTAPSTTDGQPSTDVLPDFPNDGLDPTALEEQAQKALPRCPTCNQLVRDSSPATPKS